VHLFSSSLKLQFLVGKELAQIALDPHSVQFRWSSGGQVTVQGEMEHVDDDGTTHFYDCAAHCGAPLLLHRLIQKRVISLEVQPLCLTLRFEDGQLLRLKSDEGPYECVVIQLTDDLAEGCLVY
jgi:hypothetical protein